MLWFIANLTTLIFSIKLLTNYGMEVRMKYREIFSVTNVRLSINCDTYLKGSITQLYPVVFPSTYIATFLHSFTYTIRVSTG